MGEAQSRRGGAIIGDVANVEAPTAQLQETTEARSAAVRTNRGSVRLSGHSEVGSRTRRKSQLTASRVRGLPPREGLQRNHLEGLKPSRLEQLLLEKGTPYHQVRTARQMSIPTPVMKLLRLDVVLPLLAAGETMLEGGLADQAMTDAVAAGAVVALELET